MPGRKCDFASALAALALTLKMTVSGNLLIWMGIPYSIEGGPLIAKIHPGTYVAGLAVAARMMSRLARYEPAVDLFGRSAYLSLYLAAILFCILYAAMLTGTGGLIPLIDTFLPAGLIALALQDASPASLAQLRRLLRTLFLVNALLALGEAAAGMSLIPLAASDTETTKTAATTADFRASALYDHPLTGAAATMLGLMLRSGMPTYTVPAALYDIILLVALLAFGGRAAIAMLFLVCLAVYGGQIGRAMLRRRMNGRLWAQAVVMPAMALAACAAMFATGVAGRLQTHMYWDVSAQARIDQFRILRLLNSEQIVLGCRRADFLALVEPLRLSYGVATIENFWLLLAATLGVLCFPAFLCGVAALVLQFWRAAGGNGRIMVIALFAVTSTSNSLGRKSMLLMLLAGCVAAAGGAQVCGRRSAPAPARNGVEVAA